jgi:hypothetical protein
MEKKNVTMNVTKNDNAKEGKLTYEQLNNACAELYQQNQKLIMEIRQLNQANMFKRLDYLFKVVENSNNFKPDFVVSCTEEIEEAMTVAEEPEETNNKE